jgi:glycosyltransferase involved in cell wall biosynthesis
LQEHRNCVLPMKLFSYLAARRPILAPLAPDTAELLADGETALLVEPDDPGAAAAALDRLLADAPLARRVADGAFRLALGLTWDDRARRIGGFLAGRLDQRSEYKRTVSPISSPSSGAAHAPTIGGR